jgi:hypothetical protein
VYGQEGYISVPEEWKSNNFFTQLYFTLIVVASQSIQAIEIASSKQRAICE